MLMNTLTGKLSKILNIINSNNQSNELPSWICFSQGSICSSNGYCYLLSYCPEISSIAMESRIFPTLSSGLFVFVLWKENHKVKAKLALCFSFGTVALNRA